MYNKLFSKTTLYVVRTDNAGNYRNSAPCSHCHHVISLLNIKKIVFSIDDGFVSYKTEDYTTDHISHGNRFIKTLSKKN